MQTLPLSRVHFLDHLRGFAFALMAIDHSLHAYALHFGRFWFFQDNDRELFFDALHMHNNSIIIPLLFFVIGTFVIPGLEQYGLKNYFKNRVCRYVIPFCLGIPLSVPLLSYPKYVTTEAPGISFSDYWLNVFFTEKLQAGPLWVVYALFLYTFIAVGCYLYFPFIFNLFRRWVNWMIANPMLGFLAFGCLSLILLGISDILWGAPWWIGFGKLFYFQGSRFLQQALFFFCGTTIGALGYLENDKIWRPLSDKWFLWVMLALALGGAYIGYSLTYFNEGAYSMDILYHFHKGGTWGNAWPVLKETAPLILIRTSLHAFFCLAQLLMFIALFHRFFKKPTPMWTNLARNGFGIFLIHEMIVVWLQYGLNNQPMPPSFKFFIVASVGLGSAWLLSDYCRKLPGVRLVIGRYSKKPRKDQIFKG